MVPVGLLCSSSLFSRRLRARRSGVSEDDDQITIVTPQLEAAIRKKGYVSGVAAGSLKDKKTGFRDAGFGLDIVDWIMEPGSDEAYRDQLDPELVYRFNNPYHGKTPKRSIEGPQICTKAKEVSPEVIRGKDFVAVRTSFTYKTAAPGKKTGSKWTQTIVFPEGKRYFISSDRIDAVNSSDAMFLRIDMPGHIKHNRGRHVQRDLPELSAADESDRSTTSGRFRPAHSSRTLLPTSCSTIAVTDSISRPSRVHSCLPTSRSEHRPDSVRGWPA